MDAANSPAVQRAREPIAVIGVGCRLPQAEGPEAFWQLVTNGVDAIVEVPPSRLDMAQFWDEDPAARGKTYSRWCGLVEDGDCFDAGAFGISAAEAACMDPQQGMVLECAWHALEHAGLAPDALRGSATGVFMGISNCDFDRRLCSDLDNLELNAGTGTSYSIVANRLSYVLGLCGPSIAIDLACTSSLAAIHLACQSLALGESTLALAGGVHLILSPEKTVTFSQGGVLARDGRCKSFARDADGYVRGEGCGVVVLKRLSEAQRDGDPVLAVIRGSATNHNGASNGLSAPFGAAQERVIRAALASGDIAPHTIGYLEAHSPGTLLGDSIELRAIAKVFATDRPLGETCYAASVKSNIGHLEGAAGVASFIKAALVVNQDIIPPTLHAQELNRNLPLREQVLEIVQRPVRWRVQPRRAGVSAFSFGGANAHVIVEAPERSPRDEQDASPARQLLTVSARSMSALQELVRRYADELDVLAQSSLPNQAFADFCFTAAVGRVHAGHRLALAASTPAEAATLLRRYLAGETSSQVAVGMRSIRRRSLEIAIAALSQQELDLLSPHLRSIAARVCDFCRTLQPSSEEDLERLALVTLLRICGIEPGRIDSGGQRCDWVEHQLFDRGFMSKIHALLDDCEANYAQLVVKGREPSQRVRIPCAETPPEYIHANGWFFAALRDAYVAGEIPFWPALFGAGRHKRRIPVYPFERNRYWRTSCLGLLKRTHSNEEFST